METRRVRRIVVPTDFSRPADVALTRAIEVARDLGATIELLHVTNEIVVLPPPLEMVNLPALFPDLPQRIESHLAERADRARAAGIACETLVVDGPAHVEITRIADEHAADMIVMGTHGRSGLAHAVLGSVTERVLHRTRCPVLVVPART